MRRLLVLFSVIFFCGCEVSRGDLPNESATHKKQRLVAEVRQKMAVQLKNELGLTFCDTDEDLLCQIQQHCS